MAITTLHGHDQSGATAERPGASSGEADIGHQFFDTTLGLMLTWDGTQWVSPAIKTVRSTVFNIDNGAGTTIDDVMLRSPRAIIIKALRIVYDIETTGVVAAGTAGVGSTVAGVDIAAATNYEDTKAVGTTTAMTVVDGTWAANTPIIVRHTGVVATPLAGEAHIEMDYVEVY